MDISYMKDFVIASSFGIIIALDIFGIGCIVKWIIKGIVKGVKLIKTKLDKKKEEPVESSDRDTHDAI